MFRSDCTVDRGLATSGVRGIDDVVVDQCTRLNELEGADRTKHGRRVLAAAVRTDGRRESHPTVGGSDAFSSAEHEIAQVPHGLSDGSADFAYRRRVVPEECFQLSFHCCWDICYRNVRCALAQKWWLLLPHGGEDGRLPLTLPGC